MDEPRTDIPSRRKRHLRPNQEPGFDVTCTIGRVTLGPDGDMPPVLAAFKLIDEYDSLGTFRFEVPGLPRNYTVVIEDAS